MNMFFQLNIDEIGDMTGTQLAALIKGREILNLKMQHNAKEGGQLPFGKYSKIKRGR